jgi:hypothetical protein
VLFEAVQRVQREVANDVVLVDESGEQRAGRRRLRQHLMFTHNTPFIFDQSIRNREKVELIKKEKKKRKLEKKVRKKKRKEASDKRETAYLIDNGWRRIRIAVNAARHSAGCVCRFGQKVAA